MAAQLQALEGWAGALLERLSATQRRQLALQIARELRQRNQRRMRAQTGPDGAAWQPRKSAGPRRRRKNAKSGPMMRGLAAAQWLRASATPASAEVSFAGRAQRIAQIHHYGERAAVNWPRGPMFDYPARALLGLADEDLERLRELVLDRVAGR